MNPVSLDAIKLFFDLAQFYKEDTGKESQLTRMIEKLIFIAEKDIDQAYANYSKIVQ